MLMPLITTTATRLEVGVVSRVAGLIIITPSNNLAKICYLLTVIIDLGVRVCDLMIKFKAMS
jgi:hypothetical protein